MLTLTTNSTPGFSDFYNFNQYIEGYNIADLGWGTTDAKSVTLSFWVNISVAGTYSVYFTNLSSSYLRTFTVTAPGAWEKKTITIPGPTSGTWDTTNGTGLIVGFDLGAGGSQTGSASSWLSGFYQHVAGSLNWVAGTVGATYYITGVQLEVGSTATPYEMQIYSDQLAQCQRYLPAFNSGATTDIMTPATGFCTSTTQAVLEFPFQVTPRVPPTGISVTNVGNFSLYDGSAATPLTSLAISITGPLSSQILATVGSTVLVAYRPAVLFSTGALTQILFTGCELG